MSTEKIPENISPSPEVASIEKVETGSNRSLGGYDAAETKKLIRKVDLHIVPVLVVLYLLSFLDRTNIGNARLAGLERDLKMDPKGLHYNIALAILYPFYVAAEIPSNIMMKVTKPSLWLPSTMVAWGICCTLMGLVTNFGGLLAARAALGLAEGGLFPGINFLITQWYKRTECGLRMSMFFSMATVAGAFGGLLARGISEMDGVGGRGGWAWIFTLEGIITVAVAIWSYWAFPNYPDTAKFLTEDERNEVYRRLDEDRGSLAEEYEQKYIFQAFKDWKVWAHMFNFLGTFTAVYSFSLFLPTIVRDLGYSNNTAQLMTVPPYVVACVACLGTGYASDRLATRGVFMMFWNFIGVIGLIMLVAQRNLHVKYAGTFFFACGVYPNVPQCMAWNGNNTGGSTKRSISLAMQAMCGNLGGILASFIYLSRNGPQYTQGHCILIGLLTMSGTISATMSAYYRRENRRRDRLYKKPSDYTVEEKAAEREKGDHATFFRFTV
ncbi:MFS-type transporter-like protein 23 [Elsinoe fawcettii]|nr:MFS-type transporter-like protein 23 [Elsinoe fawcettii]